MSIGANRFGKTAVGPEPTSSELFLYVPRSRQIVPYNPDTTKGYGIDGDLVPNPIAPASSDYFLYVPRAHIIIPYGEIPPPTDTDYILAENTFDIATEDGAFFIRLES
jgi:hypothetical protein